MICLCDSRRHGLVDMDMLAGFQRFAAVVKMQADRTDDRHGVDIISRQHRVKRRIGRRDTEFSGGLFRPLVHRIANGRDLDPVSDISLRHMWKHAAQAECSDTNHTQSYQRTVHARPFLNDLLQCGCRCARRPRWRGGTATT